MSYEVEVGLRWTFGSYAVDRLPQRVQRDTRIAVRACTVYPLPPTPITTRSVLIAMTPLS